MQAEEKGPGTANLQAIYGISTSLLNGFIGRPARCQALRCLLIVTMLKREDSDLLVLLVKKVDAMLRLSYGLLVTASILLSCGR